MSKPIRVMHVMGHMAGGGVEATVMNHYRYIDRSRVQFDFVIDSDSTVVPRDEIEKLGGRIFVVPPYKNLPQYLRACETLFREEKPSIVHSNVNALSVFPLAAAKHAGIPIRIAHSHSTANPKEITKTIVKNALRPFSKAEPTNLAACSEYSASWLFGKNIVDSGKVHIIKNAIDLDSFDFNFEIRKRKRKQLGVSKDCLVIGQVGRFCFQKNQLFTLEVFARLLRLRPNAILIFVGDGELRDAAYERSKKLNIVDSVRFLGVRRDVAELYQAFDVLAFPSTYEGFGMAALEAQATGLKVVTSSQVPKEVRVIPKLVSAFSTRNLSDWVRELAATSVSDVRFSELDQFVSAGYSIEDSAYQVCEWYQSLVGNSIEGRI